MENHVKIAFLRFNLNCVCLCVCVLYVYCEYVPTETPGARPMGYCELPDVVLGMELESSGRTVCSLNHYDQKFLT